MRFIGEYSLLRIANTINVKQKGIEIILCIFRGIFPNRDIVTFDESLIVCLIANKVMIPVIIITINVSDMTVFPIVILSFASRKIHITIDKIGKTILFRLFGFSSFLFCFSGLYSENVFFILK